MTAIRGGARGSGAATADGALTPPGATASLKAVASSGPAPVAGALTPPGQLLELPGRSFAAVGLVTRHATHWSSRLQRDLEAIEREAFPQQLRYSVQEMYKRAGERGFEALLLYEPSESESPEAVMIVGRTTEATVYLDTLAVRRRGAGTGSALLAFLIRRCRGEEVRAIELDTELTEGDAARLIGFYRRFGFTEAARDQQCGNLTMRLELGQGTSG